MGAVRRGGEEGGGRGVPGDSCRTTLQADGKESDGQTPIFVLGIPARYCSRGGSKGYFCKMRGCSQIPHR